MSSDHKLHSVLMSINDVEQGRGVVCSEKLFHRSEEEQTWEDVHLQNKFALGIVLLSLIQEVSKPDKLLISSGEICVVADAEVDSVEGDEGQMSGEVVPVVAARLESRFD